MMHIRPVSDLRNKYPEIEETVLKSGEPVFLTKNGYGSMVLLSLERRRGFQPCKRAYSWTKSIMNRGYFRFLKKI